MEVLKRHIGFRVSKNLEYFFWGSLSSGLWHWGSTLWSPYFGKLPKMCLNIPRGPRVFFS